MSGHRRTPAQLPGRSGGPGPAEAAGSPCTRKVVAAAPARRAARPASRRRRRARRSRPAHDLGPHRHVSAEHLQRGGAVEQGPTPRTGDLKAGQHDQVAGVGQQRRQMMDDSPAGRHARGRDDDAGPWWVVESLGLLHQWASRRSPGSNGSLGPVRTSALTSPSSARDSRPVELERGQRHRTVHKDRYGREPPGAASKSSAPSTTPVSGRSANAGTAPHRPVRACGGSDRRSAPGRGAGAAGRRRWTPQPSGRPPAAVRARSATDGRAGPGHR